MITLVTFIVLYGSYLTYFPLLMATRFGSSSLVIGLVMSATSFATVLTTMKIGWFVHTFRERDLMVAGFVCYALAMALFPLIPSLWGFLLPTLVYGFGTGINAPSSQSILMSLAPENSRAGFLSVNSTVLRIGQSLGPLIMGTIITFWGMDGVFYTGAVLSLAMMAATLAILK
jgi:MFS family permease